MLKKQKISNAFTLVELMIVVAIIAILAGMVTFAAVTTQRTTRDSSRDAKVRIIAEALEKYYNANGEYPSVAFMTGSDVNPIKQKLGIADATVFKFPNSSAANSITSSSPSSTQLQYLASTTDSTKNSQCQTDVDGYCDAFQLKYTKEVNGSVATVDSRHSDFVAMGMNYSDDFSGSGSLGNIQNGNPALAWQPVGSATWTRSGGNATTSAGIAANPMAVTDMGTSSYRVTLGTTNGGEAIYFWVGDQTNWWRLRLEGKDTTTSDGYYAWIFNVWTSQASYNAGNSPSYQNYVAQNQSSIDSEMAWCNSNGYVCQNTGSSTYNVTSTTTATGWTLYLDKSIAGTITNVSTYPLSGSTIPTTVGINVNGLNLTPFYNSSKLSQSTVTATRTNKVGFGLGGANRATPNGPTSIRIGESQ